MMWRWGFLVWWLMAASVPQVGTAGTASHQAAPTKRLVGYVAGVGSAYKVDISGTRVIAEGVIPGDGMSIGRSLWLAPDGSRVYVAGQEFDTPVVALDSQTLEVKTQLNLSHLTPATRLRAGRFLTEEFQGSSDGQGGVASIIDDDTGDSWLQMVRLPELAPTARIEKVVVLAGGRRSVPFSDRGVIATLYWHRGPGAPYASPVGPYLALVDTNSGRMLQEVKVPSNLSGNVPAQQFIPQAAGLYIVEVGPTLWLLSELEKEYVYLDQNVPSVVIAEIASGRIKHRHQIPGGRRNINAVALTPDRRLILISRGSFRPKEGEWGELLILESKSGKVRGRVRLDYGATSAVAFRYE